MSGQVMSPMWVKHKLLLFQHGILLDPGSYARLQISFACSSQGQGGQSLSFVNNFKKLNPSRPRDNKAKPKTVADPGFPVGGINLVGEGRGFPRQLRFENFVCQNERIWTLRVGGGEGLRRASANVDPPMKNLKRLRKVSNYTMFKAQEYMM